MPESASTPAPRTAAGLWQTYRARRFAHELRTEWAAALLWRPLAIGLTRLLLPLPVSPLAITLLGALLVLALPVLALLLPRESLWAVALVAALFCVLDCVDGELARARAQSSPLGAWLDGFVDLLYRLCVGIAVGVLCDRLAPGALSAERLLPGVAALQGLSLSGLAAGLLAAGLALLARLARETLPRPAEAVPSPYDDQRLPAPFSGAWWLALASGLDHALPLLMLAALWAGLPVALLLWHLLFALGDLLQSLAGGVRALRRQGPRA